MARKAVENELTREVIMEAARNLFITKGYQNISMRQIARALNYSHGSIYYHFKNKAELFYALVAEDFSLLNQKLEDMLKEENADQREKLEEVFLGFIQFGLTHRHQYEIMFLTKDEEVKSFLQEEPNQSYQKFAEAVQLLAGKHATPKLVWSTFLSLHGFIVHYIITEQSYEDAQEMAKFHVQHIINSLL